jgi:hypothetical protein
VKAAGRAAGARISPTPTLSSSLARSRPCGPPKAQATLVPALMNLARWTNPEGFLRHPVTKATASPHMYVATSYPATCLPPSLQCPICSLLHLRHSFRHCLFFTCFYAVCASSFYIQLERRCRRKQGSVHIYAATRNQCLSCMQSAVLEGLP